MASIAFGVPVAAVDTNVRRIVSRRRPSRRTEPFEGSMRQVRGAVVRELRRLPSATLGELAVVIGADERRVADAVRRLTAEGLLLRRGRSVRLAP